MIYSKNETSLERAPDPAVELNDAVTRNVSTHEDADHRQDHCNSEPSFSAASLIRKVTESRMIDDEMLMIKLLKVKTRCRHTLGKIDNKHTIFAIRMIEKICDELASMKFCIASDCPQAGYYAYDDKLSRSMDNIVFKLSELSNHYFNNSHYLHNFIMSDRYCSSKHKFNENADTWLTDRRTMVDVISAMLDEIERGE